MERRSASIVALLAGMAIVFTSNLTFVSSTQAGCGSASCFVTIGGQQSTQPEDVIRVDLTYNYLPQKGESGNRVAAVDIEDKRQILEEHRELQTLNQQFQLRVNYGITERFTAQVRLPIVQLDHDHLIEVGEEPEGTGEGEFENFDTFGLGDIELMGKYSFLPTLRSLFIVGAGVIFPTGDNDARSIEGGIQEPTLQVGRGSYGVVGQIYQSYELIPHKINQFLNYTYRHNFENEFNYQFGDRHFVNAGLNYIVTPRITLTAQLNWQVRVHDEFESNLERARPVGAPGDPIVLDSEIKQRPVRNTGFTALFFTPGITLNLGDATTWYFFAQAPLVRDFNGGLEQGVTYLTGFSRNFTLGS